MIRRRSVLQPLLTMTLALVTLLGSTALPAYAATSSTPAASVSTQGAGNGIKISPVHSDLTINPGNFATLDVYVTNVTSQTATFQVVANDFVASGDESGNPAIILNPNQSAPSHGLKQYISPIKNITIAPQQQTDVKVTITIPANAAGGGYYGAVRVLPASDDAKNDTLSLSASVASLILVRVPGDIKEQVTVASLDARVNDKSRSIFNSNKGIDGVVRFQNEGNIQEQPFGKLQVKNIRGKVVSYIEVNNSNPRGNVLPGSIRKFSIPLKGISSFGKYTIQGNFGYGSDGQLITATTTFYVIPIPIIITALVLLVLIIVLAFETPRLIRRYNQRVLRRAGR